jgi:hypothetical protein
LGAAREIVIRNAAGAVPSPTATAAPSTRSATATPTASVPTATAPPTFAVPSDTPTPTATPASSGLAPQISYFGVSTADNRPLDASGSDAFGRPIFGVRTGQGLELIVEAQPGATRRPIGLAAYQPDGRPDLQLIVSRPLGDGSASICDIEPPRIGGVPATQPFEFGDATAVVDAMNDLGCRVDDGAGQPRARVGSAFACTRSSGENDFGYAFVNAASTVQYCLPIARPWAFPVGDTVVAARVRDVDGRIAPAREIVVRVAD